MPKEKDEKPAPQDGHREDKKLKPLPPRPMPKRRDPAPFILGVPLEIDDKKLADDLTPHLTRRGVTDAAAVEAICPGLLGTVLKLAKSMKGERFCRLTLTGKKLQAWPKDGQKKRERKGQEKKSLGEELSTPSEIFEID